MSITPEQIKALEPGQEVEVLARMPGTTENVWQAARVTDVNRWKTRECDPIMTRIDVATVNGSKFGLLGTEVETRLRLKDDTANAAATIADLRSKLEFANRDVAAWHQCAETRLIMMNKAEAERDAAYRAIETHVDTIRKQAQLCADQHEWQARAEKLQKDLDVAGKHACAMIERAEKAESRVAEFEGIDRELETVRADLARKGYEVTNRNTDINAMEFELSKALGHTRHQWHADIEEVKQLGLARERERNRADRVEKQLNNFVRGVMKGLDIEAEIGDQGIDETALLHKIKANHEMLDDARKTLAAYFGRTCDDIVPEIKYAIVQLADRREKVRQLEIDIRNRDSEIANLKLDLTNACQRRDHMSREWDRLRDVNLALVEERDAAVASRDLNRARLERIENAVKS